MSKANYARATKGHAEFLMRNLQSFVGDQPIEDWLANAAPFSKIEVDVLSIEAMVMLCTEVLNDDAVIDANATVNPSVFKP